MGTSTGAPNWGSWKALTFASTPSASSFVSDDRQIRVRLFANNRSDSADLDWESVIVTSAAPAPTATATATPTPTPGGTDTLPPADARFDYQLGGVYTPAVGGGIVSRDRLAAPAAGGVYKICYVNLMRTQPDETGQSTTNPGYGAPQRWKNNHPDLLLKNSAGQVIVDAEWNEVIFDVRTAAKRAALLAIQKPWIQKCANDGFAAVGPDNRDSYSRSSNLITFPQNREYLKLVIPFTHSVGLAIAQKNVGEECGETGTTFVNMLTQPRVSISPSPKSASGTRSADRMGNRQVETSVDDAKLALASPGNRSSS